MSKNLASVMLICALSIVFHSRLLSQIEPKLWFFGKNAGLDFNTNPPQKIENSGFDIEEGGVSITDDKGGFKFLIEDKTIFNSEKKLLKNGDNIITGSGSSAQSPIAVQSLEKKNQIYLFYVSDHTPSTIGQFRYSIIDICGDNGQGEVLPNKKNILIPGNFTERLSVVYNKEMDFYWIVTTDKNSNQMICYKLDKFGLNMIPQRSNMDVFGSPSYIGMVRFNKENNKVAYSAGLSGSFRGLAVGDFDINSGLFSNFEIIQDGDIYDVEFSNNSKYLYFTKIFSVSEINRIDLETKEEVNLFTMSGNYRVGSIVKGPDRNLYVAMPGFNSVGLITDIDMLQSKFDAKKYVFNNDTKIELGLQSDNYIYDLNFETLQIKTNFSDTAFCSDFELLLDSGFEDAIWSTGEIAQSILVKNPGTYHYAVQNCGSVLRDTIKIEIVNLDTLETLNYLRKCEGSSLNLKAENINAVWIGTMGNVDTLSVFDPGTYTAVYKEGCLDFKDIYIVENDTVISKFSINDTFEMCFNSINPITIPEPFKWLYSEVNANTLNPIRMGHYVYTASNACNALYDSIFIKFDSIPTGLDKEYLICPGKNVNIELKSGIPSFWNTGDYANSIVIDRGGTYSYIIDNNCGKFSGVTEVIDTKNFIFPNIFSPNSDGVNDSFPGVSFALPTFELSVFDRWGNMVYKGNENWDGVLNYGVSSNELFTYTLKYLECSEFLLAGSVLIAK